MLWFALVGAAFGIGWAASAAKDRYDELMFEASA